MITETKNTDSVQVLFRQYIEYMSQFNVIEDREAWLKSAYDYFYLYKKKPDRYIYQYSKNGEAIGFAMVNQYLEFNSAGHAIAEFYISKARQSNGYGRELADHVFSQKNGLWEVRVAAKNTAAYRFWGNVISQYTNEKFKVMQNDAYDGYAFVFEQ